MSKWLRSNFFLLPVVFFLIFYIAWLIRAYKDVAYMDEVQMLAGNIKHLLDHDATVQDYYYRSPFLLSFSTLFVYFNCKFFDYNTYLENIISGIFLFFIACYYIKSEIRYFTNRNKFYFPAIASLIIFCLTKWELSLWGGGFSHYMVVLFGFICVGMAHKYYLRDQAGLNTFYSKYFLTIYLLLSLVSILEATSYFLPFLMSLLIVLLVNYKLFKDRIDINKWRTVLVATVALIIFALGINLLAESYSAHHPYDGYGKVNVAGNIGSSLKKISNEPLFVMKFFLIANSGNLVDKDSYAPGSFTKSIMPFVGAIVLALYVYACYLFLKRRKFEGIFAINLMLYTVFFYGMVLMGRMQFNDVYYGASSRYSAATFTGILGIFSFFLLFLNDAKNPVGNRRLAYSILMAAIVVCCLIADKNQWQIAPFRKEYYIQMADNLKADKNLGTLMGYDTAITEKARQVMIKNKLNVFKPEIKLNHYFISSELAGTNIEGFYDPEKDQNKAFRWTKGTAIIFLPNLYNINDTVKVKLACYSPNADIPEIILNDNLTPLQVSATDNGYEYAFVFREQKVFFKATIRNKSFVPAEKNSNSKDVRTLGIIFHSLTISDD